MYRLRLFGGVVLEGPSGRVAGRAVQPRRLALLALLGASRNHGWSREKLIALLWPDTDPAEARRHVSQSVYLLRKTLGDDAITSRGEFLELNASVVWTDVEAFHEAVDAGEFGRAADLYTGAFLDGFYVRGAADFEEWVETEKRQLGDAFAGAVEASAQVLRDEGDHVQAAERWRRLVSHDPYNSRAVAGLMTSLIHAGDPGNAVLVAKEHTERMRRDLGVGVPPEVEELVTGIRESQPSGPGRTVADTSSLGMKGEPVIVPSPARPDSRTRWPAMGAAVVVLVALAAVWGVRRLTIPAAPPPPDSVGVLPFLNLTGDPEFEYVVDGVTDELIANLSRLPNLRVPAQTSSFHFKDRPLDVRSIADSLGVDKILEGSVRGDEHGIVVTAQLIDAESGYHLWTETYERQATDLRSLQAHLMPSLAEELGIVLPAEGPTIRGQSANLASWQDYEKARHWWLKRSQVGTDSALHYFRRAIERDSSYALAWAGLAGAYATGLYWKHVPNTDSIHSARRASVDRAWALDPDLPEVIATRAALLFTDRDVEAAEREVLRAIDLNPNYPDAHQVYAEILHYTKRGAQAVQEAGAAYALDPMSPFRSAFLGNMLNGELRLEEAVAQWDYAIALEPNHLGAYGMKTWALMCLGRFDEASAASATIVAGSGVSDRDAQYLYYQRDYAAALALIHRLREDSSAVSYRSIGRGRHRTAGASEPRVGARLAAWSHVELEQWNQAMAEYRLSADDYPGEAKTAMVLAFIYASRGEGERARELLSAPGEIKDPPGFQAQSSTVWAELGEYDKAVDALEKAYAGRKSSVMSLAINPRMDALRGIPRFERFLERIGLPRSDEIAALRSPR